MKRLTGLRYLVPLREGSLPAVVETGRAGGVRRQVPRRGQGVKALIAEVLAAGNGPCLLGLPVPKPAIVELGAGFGEAEPDPEIQDILRGSVGTNFGLAYLAGALAFDPAADRTSRSRPGLGHRLVRTPTSPTSTARRATPTCWCGTAASG